MNRIFRIAFGLILLGSNIVQATPREDLASPDQAVRDAAAKILRTNYSAIPRPKWEAFVKEFKIGEPKSNVLSRLKRVTNDLDHGGSGTGTGYATSYRLDDRWTLLCGFQVTGSGDDKLVDCKLEERLEDIRVGWPQGFTGVWTTYWVNGQKSDEIHLQAGLLHGEFTSHYTNGAVAVVQHYMHGKTHGEDTGYFPSGKFKYKGKTENNIHVGVWVWYNEDGSIRSTEDTAQSH